ncbi:MAG: tRNA (adenosine(37)-N6)-threonylcarbamoyltransferase complex ATPase subunit type 1 TsaE [Cyanobacteria bacterium P01_A01_bin.83]
MTTLLLSSSEDTFRLGSELGKNLVAGSTLLLTGNLGAGKTTLVQGIAEGLLIPEPVVSPTFTLINEYLDGRLPLYHLDLYRLEPNQVESIYPEIYWSGIEVAPGITAIEWSEHLPFKPVNYLEIKLSATSYGRKATLKFSGKDIYNLEFTQGFTQLSQSSSAP